MAYKMYAGSEVMKSDVLEKKSTLYDIDPNFGLLSVADSSPKYGAKIEKD